MATHTIRYTGGDFTTIQAWIDDIPATLTEQRIGELSDAGASSYVWSEGIDFSGKTTTASFDIILRPAAGKGFADNFTPASDALFYNNTLGVALEQGTNYVPTVEFGSTNHITLDGIQVYKTVNNNGRAVTGSGDDARAWIIKNCILRYAGNRAVMTGGNGGYMVNTLVISGGEAVRLSGGATTHPVINVGCYNTAAATHSFTIDYSAPNFENCWTVGFNNWFDSTQNLDCVNCATTHSSINNGTGDSTGEQVSITAANEFENAASDFRLKTGSGLIGAASRQQTYTSDLDIIGQTRPVSSPDIGPWENQGGGGGISIPVVVHHRMLMSNG